MNQNHIACKVKTCIYNRQCECEALKVEIGCDQSQKPCCDHETLCRTFRKRED